MAHKFVTVSIEIMHDQNLTTNEKFILAEIEQLCSLEHGCIASNQHFATLIGITRSNASRTITNLINKGYIERSIKMGTRNRERSIKMITTYPQNDNTVVSIRQETKENIQSNIQSNIQEYVVQWNDLCEISTLAPVRNISKARETKIRKREKEDINFADLFSDIIQEIKESDFLNGLNDQGWKISFDWIFHNDTNYLKILEGNYRNNIEATKKTGTQSAIDRVFGERQEVIYAEVAE